MKKHKNYLKSSNSFGLFLIIIYVICFFWFYINPVEQDLHQRLFRLSFIGFNEMNVASFVIGLIQVYVWAYIGLGVWHLVDCCKTSGKCK